MKPQRIPLFDLGNVIVKVDFAPFLSWLTAQSRDQNAAKAAAVLHSSLFFDFEFGSIGRAEFARRLATLYGADFTQSQLEEQFCGIFPGEVTGMVELLEELAAAGPVYCLSNTNEVHLEYLRREHPRVLRSFTRVFASHELGSRKPYPGIYVGVAQALAVPPSQILFFDDIAANVAGALKAGLEAHVITEASQARDLLKDNSSSGDNAKHGGV
ncbi:MAG: HAD family hydrolase [Bdellovibrionota bacterium]